MGSLTSVQFGSGLPDTVIVTLDGTDRSSGAVFNALNANNMIEVVWTAGAGTTVTFYQNGTQKAQLTGLTIANAGAIFIVGKYNAGGNLNAGRIITNGVLLNRTDLQRYINGDVGEIIYLNYAPTTAERQLVEGYGMWRWALQAFSLARILTAGRHQRYEKAPLSSSPCSCSVRPFMPSRGRSARRRSPTRTAHPLMVRRTRHPAYASEPADIASNFTELTWTHTTGQTNGPAEVSSTARE
jgi:hypothetical protein